MKRTSQAFLVNHLVFDQSIGRLEAGLPIGKMQTNRHGKTRKRAPIRHISADPQTRDKARILLVDSQVVVRQGIASLLDREPDLCVSSTVSDIKSALQAADTSKHDLVILEINLKLDNGLELSKIFNVRHPKLPVLVLSNNEEDLYAELSLRAGAMGYVMKNEPLEKLLLAIRRVLNGQIYLSDNLTSRLLRQQIGRGANKERGTVDLLSDRELQVFQLLGQWRRTAEIAAELHVSSKTVEYYRQRIREKLQLKPGMALTQFAIACASGSADYSRASRSDASMQTQRNS